MSASRSSLLVLVAASTLACGGQLTRSDDGSGALLQGEPSSAGAGSAGRPSASAGAPGAGAGGSSGKPATSASVAGNGGAAAGPPSVGGVAGGCGAGSFGPGGSSSGGGGPGEREPANGGSPGGGAANGGSAGCDWDRPEGGSAGFCGTIIEANGGAGGETAAAGSGGAGGAGGPPQTPPSTFSCDEPFSTLSSDPAVLANCHCTRRPTGPVDERCPRGTNITVTATIGPAGGVIELWGTQTSGGQLVLAIPPGALATATTITVIETDLAPPHPLVDFSPVYDLQPHGLVFAKPVSFRLPWQNRDGDTGGVVVAYASSDACNWSSVPTSYMNAGFVTGEITTLDYLVSGYPKAGAASICP